MKVSVYNIQGEDTGRKVELPAEVFGVEPHQHSVWLDVKRYLAAQRFFGAPMAALCKRNLYPLLYWPAYKARRMEQLEQNRK